MSRRLPSRKRPLPAPPGLRGRIVLIVLVVMAALGTGIYLVANERLAISTDDYREEVADHLRRHWHNTLKVLGTSLDDGADILLDDAGVRDAAAKGDADRLARHIDKAMPALQRHLRVAALQVTDSGGRLLLSRGVPDDRPLAEGWPVASVLRFGTPVQGLQRLPDGRYQVVFVLPLWQAGTVDTDVVTLDAARPAEAATGGRPQVVGTMAFGVPLDVALRLLRQLLGHDVLLTEPETGQPISDALDPALWQRLMPRLPRAHGGAATLESGGRSYEVVTFAVPQSDGRLAAWMHLVRDVTVHELRRGLLDWATLLGSLALGLLSLWLLHAYLRRAFQPLDEAVTVLDRLARGDTSLGLATRRRDEIGRIADAIEVFRARLMELRRLDKALRRQQRRQQAFIRRQMQELAATLEAESRRAVLADLALLEGSSTAEEGDSLARELGLLAVAFRQMSERVRDQHLRLEQLVRELREALEHKTRLIALEQELEIARNIQRAILPADLQPVGGFEFAGAMLPAREVGGDFYDFFPLGGGRIGLVVADVSGKGVPAAFFMLIARTLLRAIAPFAASPGDCLARVNDLLAAENRETMFVTLFYGIVDLESGVLRYANGGHNPPLLRHADGMVERLAPTGGVALAVLPGQDYAEAEIRILPGDMLLAFSDGVTEAFAADGSIFGEARLQALLAGSRSGAAATMGEILEAVQQFAAGAEQSDDITAVAACRLPG